MATHHRVPSLSPSRYMTASVSPSPVGKKVIVNTSSPYKSSATKSLTANNPPHDIGSPMKLLSTRKAVVPSPPKVPPPRPPPNPPPFTNKVVPHFKPVATQERILRRQESASPSRLETLEQSLAQITFGPSISEERSSRRVRYTAEDFELGKTLGTGSFGRVRFARFKDPLPHEEDCRLAIKMLSKESIKKLNQIDHIKQEKLILQVLSKGKNLSPDHPWSPANGEQRHPFIVRLFGTFQDASILYMVLEFVRGGEFFCHLRMNGHFKNRDAIFYTGSVASVFAFLHKEKIVYRDLKPENLLLDHAGFLKVVDFGFAKLIPDDRTYTLCGTPEYIAPEVLLNQGHGKSVDWWALGILTYEMLSGVAPFTDEDPINIYQKILRGMVQYPTYFDPDAKSLLRKLLQVDPTKRAGCMSNGAADVLTHRWFTSLDFEKLMARMLVPPIVPSTKDADDTSCFEEYPEDDASPRPHDTKHVEDEMLKLEFKDFDTVCF